jgi:hypothetical protein
VPDCPPRGPTISPEASGAIDDAGSLTLCDSRLIGNASQGNGGGIANAGSLMLRSRRVSGNSANGSGGGILNSAAAVPVDGLVTGNTALDLPGSGLFGGGIANVAPGSVTLRGTTVAGNVPDDCAGC